MDYLYLALSLSIIGVAVVFYLEITGFFSELDEPRPDGDEGGR